MVMVINCQHCGADLRIRTTSTGARRCLNSKNDRSCLRKVRTSAKSQNESQTPLSHVSMVAMYTNQLSCNRVPGDYWADPEHTSYAARG